MPALDQPTLDRLALEAALTQALKSRDEAGIPIGAALLDPHGTVLALGHNQRVQHSDPTAHAEMVCIRSAGRRRDWHTLTMATTLSPCAMCSGCAVLHRIPRIVIGESKTFVGREDWLEQAGTQLIRMNDPRCIALMERFIADHPDLWNEDIAIPPGRGDV